VTVVTRLARFVVERRLEDLSQAARDELKIRVQGDAHGAGLRFRLGALGPLAFERTRVSAQRPAVAGTTEF
jgi:hypothetical protein